MDADTDVKQHRRIRIARRAFCGLDRLPRNLGDSEILREDLCGAPAQVRQSVLNTLVPRFIRLTLSTHRGEQHEQDNQCESFHTVSPLVGSGCHRLRFTPRLGLRID
jgi:hypothetical protein